MNMKKLMAGVVAGALAVTTLATSAFAARYPITEAKGTKYTVDFKGGAGNADAPIGFASDATKLVFNFTFKDVTIESMNLVINYYDTNAKAFVDYKTSLESGKTAVEIPVSTSAVRSGMGYVSLEKGFTLLFDGKMSTTTDVVGKDNKKLSDGADWLDLVDTITATAEGVATTAGTGTAAWWGVWAGCGKATTSDVEGAARLKIDFATEFKPNSVLRDWGADATIELELSGTPKLDHAIAFTTYKLTDAANGADDVEGEVVFSGTKATISLPAGFVAIEDKGEWDYGGKVEIAPVAYKDADGNDVTIKSVTVVTKDVEEKETSDASDSQVSEDDGNTSASDSQAPASSDDNGNTNAGTGDDKNQPTGVALAVIPAIVAAAGVVIAKKRG